MKELSVLILAAGKGSRMRSKQPKVLHPLGGRPLLAHVLDTAYSLPQQKTGVVYGHGGAQVLSVLASDKSSEWDGLTCIEQAEQLGTGHAVRLGLQGLGQKTGQLLVLYGDVPMVSERTLRDLMAQTPENGLGILSMRLDQPTGYGRMVRDTTGRIVRIVEEKDATDKEKSITEVNSGIMLLPLPFLQHSLASLRNDNAQQEYYLTDVVHDAVEQGLPVIAHCVADARELAGVNNPRQLAAVERYYQGCQVDALMEQGVRCLDPGRVDIRGKVEVGRDVCLDVNVVLEGHVVLGDNVHIGAGCCLKNVLIGAGSTIHPYSLLEDSQLDSCVQVGPFARIRPGTHLADHARIGNFVETKNAAIGSGSKASHLSYLGDCSLGRDSNIGAGTITCNYDGANKHKTVMGDRVFIGSDTQLVAPVTVADDVTIGAGSTITKDVAAGQLVLSRTRQQEISGWQRPLKKKKD